MLSEQISFCAFFWLLSAARKRLTTWKSPNWSRREAKLPRQHKRGESVRKLCVKPSFHHVSKVLKLSSSRGMKVSSTNFERTLSEPRDPIIRKAACLHYETNSLRAIRREQLSVLSRNCTFRRRGARMELVEWQTNAPGQLNPLGWHTFYLFIDHQSLRKVIKPNEEDIRWQDRKRFLPSTARFSFRSWVNAQLTKFVLATSRPKSFSGCRQTRTLAFRFPPFENYRQRADNFKAI